MSSRDSSRPARILVVEDSRQADALRLTLEEQGYDVEVVSDGRAGLETARASEFDLVISDVVMPELSGFEMCRALREDPGTAMLPVILVTTLDDPAQILEGLQAGADNYLTKPYQPEQIVARVQKVLAARSDDSALEVKFRGHDFLIGSDRNRTLRFLLPLFEDLVAGQEQEGDRGDEESGPRHRRRARVTLGRAVHILVVEDSPTQALKLQLFLESQQFEVELANTAAEALVSFREGQIDVVLSDVVMLDMSGYDLCKAIRRTNQGRDTPVILLTSLDDPVDILRGLESGADNFVVKPFQEEILLTRIEECVRPHDEDSGAASTGLATVFRGQEFVIDAPKEKILSYLFATFEDVTQSRELLQASQRAEEAARRKSHETKQYSDQLEEHRALLERQVAERTEQLRESKRRETLLKEAAIAAAEADDVDEALVATLDYVTTFTGWPIGHAYLVSVDDPELLEPTKLWHVDDDERFRVFMEVTERTTFATGEGLPGRILASGEPAWIVDVTEDPNFPRAKLVKDIGVKGAFGFPVVIDREVVAVLEFFSDDVQNPDAPLLEMIGQVGIQLGGFLVRKRAQERYVIARDAAETANAELARAAEAKDEFLSSMSHELRTPLNAVLSLSESLIEGIYGDINEKQQKTIGMIETSGRHLLSLINDILDLSKVAAGKMELSVGAVDIPRLCESSLLFVRERAMKKRLKLTSNMDPRVVTLQADERRLKQVLVNLLTNAVKFTEEGEVGLDVTGDRDAKQVRFVVRDTGIGIAEEDLEQLWTPFSQLDSGLDRQYEGTGLGLSLVKEMTELHGGSVEVTSEGVGNGSQFTMILPWEPDAAPEQVRPSRQETGLTEEVPKQLQPSPVSRSVLLAEDNETNIAAITDYLDAKGFQVRVARNGIEALEAVRDERPDIVLMDIQMPRMDGIEAIRVIRQDSALEDLPIIALTALAMSGDEERIRDVGANDYLTKPVSMKELVVRIERLINR